MTQWIISCNLKYYDVDGAFQKLDKLDWKQSNKNVQEGDIVYLYISAPVRAIRYKCKVNKVNLPEVEINDKEFRINGEGYDHYGRHMELELLEKFSDTVLSHDILAAHGLKGNIQCPRRISGELELFFASLNQ